MRLYNLDHQPTVVDHSEPAVMPGECYDFTKEQVAAGLSGSWSKDDPRKGLRQEREFKRARDTVPARADNDPGQPGEEE